MLAFQITPAYRFWRTYNGYTFLTNMQWCFWCGPCINQQPTPSFHTSIIFNCIQPITATVYSFSSSRYHHGGCQLAVDGALVILFYGPRGLVWLRVLPFLGSCVCVKRVPLHVGIKGDRSDVFLHISVSEHDRGSLRGRRWATMTTADCSLLPLW